jgi:glycosyltransferase involved in cell wall biosynthesis
LVIKYLQREFKLRDIQMKKEIKYIGYYDVESNSNELRGYALAATNKMDYISKVLNRIGYDVLIVSPSRTRNKKHYKGKIIQINDNVTLKLFPTFPWGNKLQKAFSLIIGDAMLFLYLIFNIRKNENIIVYHSLGLRNTVRYAKLFKGFKVILEVEEIYQDVMPYSMHTRKEEYKSFRAADKYIFSTEMLNAKLNQLGKPYTIINGTYQVEEDRNVKFDDEKIHVIYAGTFDPRKGGALAAAAAEFLPENYHVHIIGFGSNEDKNKLLKKIDEISKMTRATVTYDGLLRDEEYIQFLQKCHIGLSTQNPDAEYNDTSFPSKILSYMANGLRVVTVRIKAIETSAIGDKVYYYEKQTPKDIAETIMSIDFNEPYDSRKIIKKLDEKFVEEIKALLKV